MNILQPLALSKYLWPYGLLAAVVFASSLMFLSISYYAFTIEIPEFPDLRLPVQDQKALDSALDNYVTIVDFVLAFMTTIIGLLVGGILMGVVLVGVLLYIIVLDKKKLFAWQEAGFSCERLEFIGDGRIRLNNTEIMLNKTQFTTFKSLLESRLKGEALHPADIPSENATQTIKRLREELGAKLIEKTLIVNHRTKGYWVEVDPKHIKGLGSGFSDT